MIGDHFNNVKKKLGTDDILKCLCHPSFNILFQCDGYDERNDSSSQLFSEICGLKEKHNNIRVIVTSRPEAVQPLYTEYESQLPIEHLKVKRY